MPKQRNMAQEIEQLKQERDRARQALQTSRTRFRNIIEKNADGVLVVNHEGMVRFVNAAAKNILGRRAEELLGEMFGFPLVAGDTTELDIVRNGDTAVVEMRVVESEWEDEPVFLASLRDITVLKLANQSLRESKEQITKIVESINDGFFALDNRLVITYFNPSAEQLLGRKQEEVIGRHLFDEAFPEAKGSVFEEKYTRALKEKVSISFETYFGISPYENWYEVRVFPFQDGISVFFQVITGRKQVEQQLRFQSQLLDSVRESVVATDLAGNVIYWGKGAEMLYGYQADEIVGKPITVIVESDETQEELERINQVNETGSWRGEYVQKRKDGSSFWADTFISLVKDEQGQPTGMIGIDHDITERKFAEKSLEEALVVTQQHEKEVSSLLGASRAVLEYQDFEPAARAIFEACKGLVGAVGGYVALLAPDGEENEVLFLDSGDLPCSVDPELPMPIRGLRAEAYRTGNVVYHNDFSNTEWIDLMPEGHMGLESVMFAPLVLEGKTVGLVGLANKAGGFTDHDTLMAAAFGELAAVALRNSRTLESLKAALHEKEILLQEIHHRVKNNLAIVSSLLDLQAEFIDDEKTQQALRDSQSRIVSMARVHEHLYRSHDLSEIDMANYIQNLVDHLQSVYGTAKAIITVNVAPNISLDIQTAIPCGLCINELVTNALKYAFPPFEGQKEQDQHNHVQVELYANDATHYTLKVKDNGVGLAADFDWENASSLGLQLVRVFTQQLRGSVTLDNDTGTTFSLVFPKPNSARGAST